MNNNITINNLTKKIKGRTVLENISVSFDGGKIYGLVGKNGSGKTMLIRAISGMMRPTEGEILYNGKKLYKQIDFIPNIGVVIENVGLYPEFTGFKNLKLLANIRKRATDEDIKSAISAVGLDPEDKRTVKKYSLGMKQKIVLAQAFMEKPDVLLLDEPTNALDEESVANIRSIIKQEAERGAIVLIASHNKEDIELLCDEVFFISDGKMRKKEVAAE